MGKYKPINGWTKRKILGVIRKRRYNYAAVNSEGHCVYLTNKGNRCAVGLFIPPGHEGQHSTYGVESLLREYPELKKAMPLGPKAMFEFQDVHDMAKKNAKQAMLDWVKENVE